ncbi:hypothetical protein OK016_16865 [Vibrio chagasii]|nr:hypothetical protein [Vibrio chagasii]
MRRVGYRTKRIVAQTFSLQQDVDKVSPVVAYEHLNHIRQAWNCNPSNKLEDQDVVVTVPASFDETAQGHLKVELALSKILLLGRASSGLLRLCAPPTNACMSFNRSC